MRSFSLLSIAFFVGFCYCIPPNSKGSGGNATQNSREVNPASQVQRVVQQIPQEKQTVPSTNVGAPTPAATVIKTVELDLKDVDNEIFLAKESSENGVVEKTFTVKVKESHRLTEVYELNVPVWKSDSPNKHCTLATVHFEGENPMLASLSLNQGFVYLKNKDGKWVAVSKEDYDAALTNMKARASLPEAKAVELDLTEINENLFTIEESFAGGVPIKTVTPKEGNQLTEVYDLNVPLWKGADKEHGKKVIIYYDGESPASVVVNFVKADGTKPWKYHNLQDNKWNVVNKQVNENFVKELMKKAPQFPPPKDPKTLDLASLADSRYKTVDLSIDGVPARVYVVGPKEDINKVECSEKEVWKAPDATGGGNRYNVASGQKCTCCITFLQDTSTNMAVVDINDGNVLREIFKFDRDEWKKATNYPQDIAALKTYTDPPAKFTLDISSPKEDGERFKLVKEEKNGVTTQLFATKQGHLIQKVMDGKMDVYTVPRDQVCYLCEIHSKGTSKLLRIHSHKDYKIEFQCYESAGSGWKVVERQYFGGKLENMQRD